MGPTSFYDLVMEGDTGRVTQFPWYNQGSAATDILFHTILQGLAAGLSYLHGIGIKHKDIKPDNLLIKQELKEGVWIVCPIITDLGVSKVISPNEPTNYTKSTYQYLSPEQVARKDSTPLSDIFSLGCCFCEGLVVLFLGERGHDELESAYKDHNRSCQFARELPHVLEILTEFENNAPEARYDMVQITLSMLTEDASKRPDSAEIYRALREINFS